MWNYLVIINLKQIITIKYKYLILKYYWQTINVVQYLIHMNKIVRNEELHYILLINTPDNGLGKFSEYPKSTKTFSLEAQY